MGRGRRERPGHRGGDVVDLHGPRGSDDGRWKKKNAEDDPLRDLRPPEEDPENPDEGPVNPDAEEYVWPDMHDENEEDD